MSDKEKQTKIDVNLEAQEQATLEVVYVDKLLDVHDKVRVPYGTILLEALKKVGFMYGPCGGLGMCGRCVVDIVDGQGGQLVQACSYSVTNNITIRKWRGR